jgi:DNA-binding CsgD family transcriptional regulator
MQAFDDDVELTPFGITRQAEQTQAPAVDLSPREREVLALMSKGFSIKESAKLMNISHHTVVTFVRRLYRKLNVHSKSEAVFEAHQLGLFDPKSIDPAVRVSPENPKPAGQKPCIVRRAVSEPTR